MHREHCSKGETSHRYHTLEWWSRDHCAPTQGDLA